jgi:NADH-quinone oxidoreductase subunit F
MLGTKALQVFDETTCVVRAVLRWTEFYKHESCGKCTPCREGTFWLVQILRRWSTARATEADLEKLLDICDNILGRSFCALGDGADQPDHLSSSSSSATSTSSTSAGRSAVPFDPAASTLFDVAPRRGATPYEP